MNKEQEAKCRAAREELRGEMIRTPAFEDGWAACLVRNGIGLHAKTNGAPEWVIEMMRTGKAVRCKVWDDGGACRESTIIGYFVDYPYPYYADDGRAWKHAEPLPAWTPKEEEAVFVNLITGIQVAKVLSADDGNVVQVVFSQGERRAVELDRLKLFDAFKIGNPWGEI